METNTWLWSWANNSVEEARRGEINEVRAFGEEHSLRELTEPYWPGDVVDGWAMTSVAAYLLKAKAAYRGPVGHLYLFMILMDLRWA